MARPRMFALSIVALLGLAVAPGARAQCTVTPHESWQSAIVLSSGLFFVMDADLCWLKLTVLGCDPSLVLFQNSRTYPFHYDFIRERVDPYLGISRDELDRISLFSDGQEIFLGAIMVPRNGEATEYGIQLIRSDPYEPAQVRQLFELIRSRVVSSPPARAFYFPTYEQQISDEDVDELASYGITVSSPARWAQGNACYSNGWALGSMRYVTGEEIDDAYLSGSLGPGDILLTDGVPAEVPMVAGIATLSPSTPSSHVAILANTYGVPFVHLALADDAARARQLVDRMVVLRAEEVRGACRVRLIDAEDQLTRQQIDDILMLKQAPHLEVVPITPYGAIGAPTDTLLPSDIRYFGGKASNFGVLRRAIPDASPVAGAIAFDLWSSFLDQTLPSGRTLGDEIAGRLATYSYPPDVRALSDDLEVTREMLTDDETTSFSDADQQAVVAFLQAPEYGFDAGRMIRFRSSTNVEDTTLFTGAGLYDSYSGCLADDLDGDDVGPSRCDPNEPKERGVFRAIRKVFASFYNTNAFIERLRHGVDECEVGMALLVHHSFPDELELANGVATVTIHSSPAYEDTIMLVTQAGAVSVANPEGGSIPEIVELRGQSLWATLVQRSNLVILGDTVLEWDADYLELGGLLMEVAEEYEATTGTQDFVLDLEYKKVAPEGRLIVKQVREIPQPDLSPSITPFLINEPTRLCVVQGANGASDVFANHRLKSRWLLETDSFWLEDDNLARRFYSSASIEQALECEIENLEGSVATFPGASYRFEDDDRAAVAGWALSDLANPRSYELRTAWIDGVVAPSESPILSVRDWQTTLRVSYEEPVVAADYEGTLTTTSVDEVRLAACAEAVDPTLHQDRRIEDDGVTITTSFYLAPSLTAYFGRDLARFEETVIEGVIDEPITLHGFYSQTYDAEHHNRPETFVYDPWLDPEVSTATLQKLETLGVRLVFAFIQHDHGVNREEIRLLGDADGCTAFPPRPRRPTGRTGQ